MYTSVNRGMPLPTLAGHRFDDRGRSFTTTLVTLVKQSLTMKPNIQFLALIRKFVVTHICKYMLSITSLFFLGTIGSEFWL